MEKQESLKYETNFFVLYLFIKVKDETSLLSSGRLSIDTLKDFGLRVQVIVDMGR